MSIGYSGPKYENKYKGFYKKLWKFCQILLEKNQIISDKLVVERLLK